MHILDHATFSNITEQFRSVYRDTMGPPLKLFEGFLAADLHSAVRPGNDEPDFGGDVYAEFLLDEVLRGDFEKRADAYRKAEHMTVAEKRELENLPYVPGTDRIFINSASMPITGEDEEGSPVVQVAGMVRTALAGNEKRTLMGRLTRVKSLDEIDPAVLTAGLNGAAATVTAALDEAIAAGEPPVEFRERQKTLGG